MPSGEKEEICSIRLWELPSGQEIRRFEVEQNWVWSLAFSPDGRTLASGGGDSTILLWDLTGRRGDGFLQPARLTPGEVDKLWTDLSGEAAHVKTGMTAAAAGGKIVVGTTVPLS